MVFLYLFRLLKKFYTFIYPLEDDKNIKQTYALLQLKKPLLNEDVVNYIALFVPFVSFFDEPFKNTKFTMYDLEDLHIH